MTGTVGEIPIFLGAIYGGLIIGLLFTAFRLPQLLFGTRPLFAALLDGAFYILAGVIAALTLYRLNGGTFRVYPFLGIAMGIAAEYHTVDALIRPIMKKWQNSRRKH